MQDFYTHFKIIFDLKIDSFINFIDKYIEAGNYVKKYGNFENISEYFKNNGGKFSKRKFTKTEISYSFPDTDFKNIFE
jgi:hypothetical protein